MAFDLAADAGEAERFNRVIEKAGIADAATGDDDDQLEGIGCRFDKDSGTLGIFETDGAPNPWSLAKALQRILPARLPIGLVYPCSCDKPRSDGFGGSLFAVGAETIVQRDLGELLTQEIAELGETSDDR